MSLEIVARSPQLLLSTALHLPSFARLFKQTFLSEGCDVRVAAWYHAKAVEPLLNGPATPTLSLANSDLASSYVK